MRGRRERCAFNYLINKYKDYKKYNNMHRCIGYHGNFFYIFFSVFFVLILLQIEIELLLFADKVGKFLLIK